MATQALTAVVIRDLGGPYPMNGETKEAYYARVATWAKSVGLTLKWDARGYPSADISNLQAKQAEAIEVVLIPEKTAMTTSMVEKTIPLATTTKPALDTSTPVIKPAAETITTAKKNYYFLFGAIALTILGLFLLIWAAKKG